MPEGMSRKAPVGEQGSGFKFLNTTDQYGVTSIHKIPMEQFVHAVDEEVSCLCGPEVDYRIGDRVVPIALHYALDGEYYESYWGPDGPDDFDWTP